MENFILVGNFDSRVVWKEASFQRETNAKVIKLILEVLPNKIMCRIGKYKNAHDFGHD